jgi:predicted ester cyclase
MSKIACQVNEGETNWTGFLVDADAEAALKVLPEEAKKATKHDDPDIVEEAWDEGRTIVTSNGDHFLRHIAVFQNRTDNDACACQQRFALKAMIKTGLSKVYRGYIRCLNEQDWPKLEQFVDDEVSRNGRQIGLSGYRKMLENDFSEIPDLHFNIELLISGPPYIASRLAFDCSPKARFLGLDVNGKRVSFAENVFYEFRREKIWRVWSIIDKAAIEAQL